MKLLSVLPRMRRFSMLPDVHFAAPLSVRFPNGLIRAFDGLHDAVDFLENEWPLRHGDRYAQACKTCRAALNRAAPIAVAREAFVAACLEAGLPVQALPPAWHRSHHAVAPRQLAEQGR
jgi:hypothetical protein